MPQDAMTKRIYIIPLFLSENLEWECDQVIGEKVPTDTKKRLMTNAALLNLNNAIFIKANMKKQNLKVLSAFTQSLPTFASSNGKQFSSRTFWPEFMASKIPECLLALIDSKF